MPEYANATNLPAELVTRIVELLSGAVLEQPETRGEDLPAKKFFPPPELRKRELGNCSLVCKYWARYLRPRIFENLTLTHAEDGRRFDSLIRSPVSPELSIAGIVDGLRLVYDISGPPWLHLVYLSLWNHSTHPTCVNLEVLDSSATSPEPATSPVLASTIFHKLPRPLSKQIMPRCWVSLQGLHFSNLPNFHKFLASIQVQVHVVLNSINILDTERMYVQPHRRNVFFKSLTIVGGNAPLRMVCSMLSTRLIRFNYFRRNTLQTHIVARVEEIAFSIMQTCPVIREWVAQVEENEHEPERVEASYQHARTFRVQLPTFMFNYISISEWCEMGDVIDSIGIEISDDSTLSLIRIAVGDPRKATSLPWAQFDQDLWELAPSVQRLAIQIDDEHERYALVKAISRRMVRFVQAGKLKFEWHDNRQKRVVYSADPIVVDSEDEEEDEEEEENSAEGWGEGDRERPDVNHKNDVGGMDDKAKGHWKPETRKEGEGSGRRSHPMYVNILEKAVDRRSLRRSSKYVDP